MVGEAIAPLFKAAPERCSINRSVASVTFDGTNSALKKMCSTSVEGNARRMNYYVPIMQDDGVAQCGEDTVAW